MDIPPPLPRSLQECSPADDAETMSDDASSSTEGKSREQHLASAESLRLSGNEKLKSGNFSGAVSEYKRGIKEAGKIFYSSEKEVEQYQKTKQTKVALNLNLALAHIKLSQWPEASRAATDALSEEPNSTKGLYRRGVARSRMGLLEEAKQDLIAVVQAEPNNGEARKELCSVKEKLKQSKVAEKQAFGNLFAKTAGLYEDRQRQVAEEAEAARKAAEAEREEWKQEMAATKSDITFEDWKAEKKRKREAESTNVSTAAKKPPTKPKATSSDTVELDDEDLKAINETKRMGYCYFRTAVDDAVKEQLQATNKPQLIEKPQEIQQEESPGAAISAWNKEGTTYEEKDVSQWAVDQLKKLLMGVMVKTSLSTEQEEALKQQLKNIDQTLSIDQIINKCPLLMSLPSTIRVKDAQVTGEAEVMVVRGTKRYMFDFDLTIKWEWELNGWKDSVLTSIVKLPEKPTVHKGNTLKFTGVDATSNGGWFETTRAVTTESRIEQTHPLLKNMLKNVGTIFRDDLIRTVREFEKVFASTH